MKTILDMRQEEHFFLKYVYDYASINIFFTGAVAAESEYRHSFYFVEGFGWLYLHAIV